MELFERSLRMFAPFAQQGGPAAVAPPRPVPEERELGDDLESLQKQLSEMQEQLERLSRSKV